MRYAAVVSLLGALALTLHGCGGGGQGSGDGTCDLSDPQCPEGMVCSVVLDSAGADPLIGWGLAFASLGVAVFMGPVALALLARRVKT